MSAALVLTVGGLVAVGVYLITARSLSRIVLGFSLLGHAAVLALLAAGGPAGEPPLADGAAPREMSNPLSQALSLTAIVISFGLTLFLLALARRQRALTGDDLVEDDLEDRRIAGEGETDVSTIVALLVVGPLIAAAAGLVLGSHARLRDAVTLSTLFGASTMAAVLVVAVEREGTIVVRVGAWSPDLGIVLVADLFAAMVLFVAVLTIAVVEVFAIGQRRTPWGANPRLAGPLICVLTGGVSLAFLTGDLFTLFVAFELILVSSYVLLTHQGHRGQIRSGMTYVVMNLLASTLFLIGIAFVYTATGTVNLARLAERIPELSTGVRLGIGLWFLVVFGTKAAMFPLFSWLPDSYPTAPTTITAVFAGLLTKVGVYALIRFNTLTAMDDLGGLILVIAGVTMIVGVAGALAQDDVKRILSFHVVSQIGYMLMGLGLFSVAGVAGAILFLVHQIPVKTVLFLVGGLIEDDQGTSALGRVGGLAARRPIIALLFALPALSLAGLPPFSGFVAKLALVDAGVANGAYAIVAVSLVGSVLTLLSMTKIWIGVFWGTPGEQAEAVASGGSRRTMLSAAGVAVAMTISIAVLAGPLWNMSERAATDLMARSPYVEEVLG